MRRTALRTRRLHRSLTPVLCLIFAVLFPTISASAETAAYQEECWTADANELAFLDKVNEVRRSRGLVPVRLDIHLSRVTQNHSHVMRAEQRLNHTRGTLLHRQVSGEEALGETVGRGTSSDHLFEAFMQSPAHRNVILTKQFRFLGVGVSYDNDGSLWTTLLFESQTNPGTTMRMDPC